MKHLFRKLLALGLCVVLTAALFPSASAAKPEDLRRAAANQAKALSTMKWKVEKRIKGHEFPDYKYEAMHKVGLRFAVYFEYSRTQTPYLGAIIDETSASYEQILAQLTEDGMLLKNDTNTYYGMNADAFLVDVVSRVSPTPISGVKQAMSSGALTPLVSGVDLTASSSQLAVTDKQALTTAYGKLNLGDLVISWDDSAQRNVSPTLHVMVVTDVGVDGTVTFTYPAYGSTIFHFTCSSCGTKSTEGPTLEVIAKHIVSKNYAFSSFATHSSVDPSSGCSGTWQPDGGTTWRTKTVSLDELSGNKKFAEGGVCYIPFTLPVYTNGAPDVKVTLDTQTTAETLAAGFSGTIHSNYRITQVDAILSTTGAPDQVFTHYPAYDAWSYEFDDSALNQALVTSSTGNCSLVVNVHSGPIADPNTMTDPVTKIFDASVFLNDPSFELTSDTKIVHQGQNVRLDITPIEANITTTEMELSFNRKYYTFNFEKSRSANKNITFSENANGFVTLAYSGPALPVGEVMAQLYFTPHRTGSFLTPAEQAGVISVRTAWKATTTNPTLVPARFGGEAMLFDIGYNVKVFEDYAADKTLILVATEGSPAKVTYNNQQLREVTDAHYRLDGVPYTHTYAIVVDRTTLDLNLISAEAVESTAANLIPILLDYDCDVNRNGSVDISDAQAIVNIMNGYMPFEGNAESWLVADVDASGKIDTADITAVLAAIR